MVKMIAAALAAALTASAAAQMPPPGLRSFLVAQWHDRGSQFCKYDNGTILNVGINLCPLSIPA